eukprot:3492654-Lingulodinium_polyedra.AAC.1
MGRCGASGHEKRHEPALYADPLVRVRAALGEGQCRRPNWLEARSLCLKAAKTPLPSRVPMASFPSMRAAN